MNSYCPKMSRLLTTAAVLCTANIALGQSLSTSGRTGSSGAGVDVPSCGGTLLTQNTNPDMVVAGTVSCNAGGVNQSSASVVATTSRHR